MFLAHSPPQLNPTKLSRQSLRTHWGDMTWPTDHAINSLQWSVNMISASENGRLRLRRSFWEEKAGTSAELSKHFCLLPICNITGWAAQIIASCFDADITTTTMPPDWTESCCWRNLMASKEAAGEFLVLTLVKSFQACAIPRQTNYIFVRNQTNPLWTF